MLLFGLKFWKARPALEAADIADETQMLVLSDNRLATVPRSELQAIAQTSGGVTLPWKFGTATTNAAIAASDVRLNNAAAASATTIFIHETSLLAVAASAFLSLLVKGSRLVLRKRNGDGSQLQIFSVVSNTDSGTFRTVVVTHVFGNGEFAADDEVLVTLLGAPLPALPADNVTKVLRSVNGTQSYDGIDFDKTAFAGYNGAATQTLKHINGVLTWVTDV